MTYSVIGRTPVRILLFDTERRIYKTIQNLEFVKYSCINVE
jgi:hypothetical protein